MKMMHSLLSAVAVLMLVLTMPARAVDVPEQAIGENTALVVWVDLEQVDTEMIQKLGDQLAALADNPILADQAQGIPLGEIGKMKDVLTTLRNGFLQAGGQGLMLTLEMPGEDSLSPPMSVLAKTGQAVDTKAMAALVRTMSEGAMDAELAPVVEGWHDLAIVDLDKGVEVTQALPKPDKKAFKAFDKQLGDVKKPIISVAFRMQDELREMIGQLGGLAGDGGGQQDPQAQMMLGMLEPLKRLETLGFAISKDKDAFEVDAQMVFDKPGDAQQFAQMYNSILMFVPVILAGEAQKIQNAPDANTINSFFMKLQMTQNGDTLKLHLDKEFFELVDKMAPLFEAFGEQGQQVPAGDL